MTETICARGMAVDIESARGGTVSAITLDDGRDLLWAIPPDVQSSVRSGEQSPSLSTWIEQTRGGWEFIAPNAGKEGIVEGQEYPFHGTLGRMRWDVVAKSRYSMRLQCSDHDLGFLANRLITIRANRISVTESLECIASTPKSATWGSHLAFGGSFLDGQVEISVPTHTITNESHHAEDSPYRHTPVEGTASLQFLRPISPHRGIAHLHNHRQGISAHIQWKATSLPYVWVWIELGGTTDWPWHTKARAIGIEPMSTWPDIGTQGAIEAGRPVLRLQPGGRVSEKVSLTIDRR